VRRLFGDGLKRKQMRPSSLGSSAEIDGTRANRGASSRTRAGEERRAERKIRFTAAEWRLVEERARTCGRAPARYVREAALGAVLKVSRTRGNAPIIRELGAIASSLQAVKRGDSRSADGAESDVSAQLDALVARVLGVVDRLT
jgi:hypothetical protein